MMIAMLVIGGMLATGVAFAAGANGKMAGCLTNSGTLVKVAKGNSPSAGCGAGEEKIVWNKKGKRGKTGAAGADGVDGADGIDGTNGKDGKNGADGADGKSGVPGPKGETGKAGTNGTDGKTGPAGINGKDGADGKNGTDGEDGISGVEIVSTVNKDTPGYTQLSVSCPTGKSVIGGGAEALGAAAVLVASKPNASATGWTAVGDHPGFPNVGLSVYAICAIVN